MIDDYHIDNWIIFIYLNKILIYIKIITEILVAPFLLYKIVLLCTGSQGGSAIVV